MSLSLPHREETVVHGLIPQLEADGYEVFLHPTPAQLPPFLQNLRPDAIALKGAKKIAIEVVGDPRRKAQKPSQLADAFASHPEWELRLIYAPPRNLDDPIPVSSRDTIEQHLERIEGTIDVMGGQAALLTAWAVFEAALRHRSPERFSKPQPTACLLETMAFDGYATPAEAERLREIGKVRNEVAHGRLDLVPSPAMVVNLINLARTILNAGD